jgi:hypothetical protein
VRSIADRRRAGGGGGRNACKTGDAAEASQPAASGGGPVKERKIGPYIWPIWPKKYREAGSLCAPTGLDNLFGSRGLSWQPKIILGPSVVVCPVATLLAHVNTHGTSVFPAKMRRRPMASFLSHVQLQEEEAEKDRWTCRFGTVRPRSCSTSKGLEGSTDFLCSQPGHNRSRNNQTLLSCFLIDFIVFQQEKATVVFPSSRSLIIFSVEISYENLLDHHLFRAIKLKHRTLMIGALFCYNRSSKPGK